MIDRIADGASVLLPQGCAEPLAFYEALGNGIDRFHDLRLYSGLQFGAYGYLARGLNKNFSYTTWHVNGPARKLARAGEIGYMPLRYSEVAGAFPSIDVLVLQVSKPIGGNRVSLGVSVSLNLELLKNARCVVAEVTENMPVTSGQGAIPIDAVDYFIEGRAGPVTHARTAPGDVEIAIAGYLCGLIPRHACLQLGIGGVPEALIGMLSERDDIRIHTGMVTDGFIPFIERSRQLVIAGEAMGSGDLFEYIDDNPKVELRAAGYTHNPSVIGAIDGFVSVNSALQVDLTGQVNAEAIGAAPVSGIGGSMDFFEGAARSKGGKAILALASTAAGGKLSRIVPSLDVGAPVTLPRQMVHYVVTEHGVADLRGKTLRQRSRALADIAHPDFRDELRDAAPAF